MRIRFTASTIGQIRNGLMFEPPLSKEECVLFIFPYEGAHKFWNKNVSFPISLIFCDRNLVVKEVSYLNSNQTEIIKPNCDDILYVIEAHETAPQILNIQAGVKIIIENHTVNIVKL